MTDLKKVVVVEDEPLIRLLVVGAMNDAGLWDMGGMEIAGR